MLETNEHSGASNLLNQQSYWTSLQTIFPNHYKNVKERNSFKYNKTSKKGSKDSRNYHVNESKELHLWLKKKNYP